jgi:hypothetical protein
MPLVQTSIASVLAKTNMSNADKKALLSVLNGMADDIEILRNQVAQLLPKLDAAGATVAALGTNNVSTLGVAKTSMNVKKS